MPQTVKSESWFQKEYDFVLQADAEDEQEWAGAAEAGGEAAAGAVDGGCGGGTRIGAPQKVCAAQQRPADWLRRT